MHPALRLIPVLLIALLALALPGASTRAAGVSPGGVISSPPPLEHDPVAPPRRLPPVHRPAPGQSGGAALEPRQDEGPGVRVPVLMYHYIRVNPNPRDAYGADLSVPPAHFAAQMALLVRDGFTTITPDALIAALDHGVPLPPRPVLLTFDDGYADFYTAAYPVLERLGLRATSFVITGRVGTPGYLTWDDMRAMQAGGLVQFEAHTVDHVEMAHIPLARAEFELSASKASLEAHLDTPVAYFCYPSGDYDPAVEHLLAAGGYRAAFTTQPGLWHHPGGAFALTRTRVHGGDTLAGFEGHLGLSAVPGPELPTSPPADPRPAEPGLVPH